jgi:hypothetical protein
MKKFVIGVFVVALMSVSIVQPVAAQNQRLQCGDTIEGEFSENSQLRQYSIVMQPGDLLNLSARAFGGSLLFAIFLQDPAGNIIYRSQNASSNPTINTDVLGARGTYYISMFNGYSIRPSALGNGSNQGGTYYPEGFGVGSFNFSVGCTFPDGTICEPGNCASAEISPTQVVPPQLQPITVGFTGIAPIDFSNVSLNSFGTRLYGVPVTSNVSAGGSGLSGFRLDGAQDDVLEISARRTAGDLPVGFVIFAEPNIPVFVAGPVSSTTFSTQVTLPQDGSYVIGLFRMGESPAGAQDTAFQITINLNPLSAHTRAG